MIKVLEKDYDRLERGRLGKQKRSDHTWKEGGKSQNDGNYDHTLTEAGVLDKRSDKRKDNQDSIEVGLRVWSKKGRNKKVEEGRMIHMVNRGKRERDRGVSMETWNIREFKEKKGEQRGAYTRVCVYGKDSMKRAKGRENLYNCVQKNRVDQDRKRIGMGMKESGTNDRKWMNIKRRKPSQLLQRLTRCINVIKTDIQNGKRDEKLKEMYILTIMKTLRKQVMIRMRRTSNRKKETV